MITIEQINFAGDLAEVFSPWTKSPDKYFLEMAVAIEEQDTGTLARLCAFLIIEVGQKGAIIAQQASRWIQLFGKLPEFALDSPSTSC